MKNKLLIFLIILFSPAVFAGSINPAVYKTMSSNSYRSNYNRQITNRNMPYWQAQSNFSTRNRTYQDFSNYNRHMNDAINSNFGNQNYRRGY